MSRNVKAMTTMRIDPEKLDFIASLGKAGSTYDGILGKILDFVKRQPDFRKRMFD